MYNRLATQITLSADLHREARHFRRKLIKLIHHLINRLLKQRNLLILLNSMNKHLLTQITCRNSRNNRANLTERLLERNIGLLMLDKLFRQRVDVAKAMVKRLLLCFLLAHYLGAQALDLFALAADVLGLAVEMLFEIA